jgi:signal transduction histidine kinase
MLADSDRLLHTVEQVLRAGQTGGRRRPVSPSPIDLDEIVRECLELARTRYHLAAEALRYTKSLGGGERAVVLGDPDELRAAVSNLIDNAIKYSDKQVQVSVELAALNAKRVLVRVTDRGIGIPRGQLKRVFKRFYRVPRRVMTRVKGNGLGLFIVRSVVEKHGGRAFAESEGEGQGSTFTIQLRSRRLPGRGRGRWRNGDRAAHGRAPTL